jgi:hypothetical protein
MERLGSETAGARRRYQVAFFALGWLIVIGLAFHFGALSMLRRAYGRAEGRLTMFAQHLSDAEGTAVQRTRHTSRSAEMLAAHPRLHDRAWLARPDRLLWGIYDGDFPSSFAGFTDAESRLRYQFPIVSVYQAWGDRPDEAHFPSRVVETIDRLGSVPMITWEPWVKDFDETLRPNLPPPAQREYASLAAIARGDYDFYVTAWAAEAAKFGKPLFLRFAHEMNDPYRYPWGPQNGNRPDDFIAAWRHVHLIFQKMNATNVLWVWSPHISMPWFEYYYPGDEWVDWTGTGVLNYGTVASWSRWWSFHQILEKAWPSLAKIGKPVMITEFGTLADDGDAGQWYTEAFHHLDEKYSAIRAVVLFNQTQDATLLTTEPLNWSALQDAGAAAAVRDHLSSK